jgi:transketolase
MPGISSPGGPSHQAIEDVALMRALPGMTVIDIADATETVQAVAAIADLPGPVYLRLKRGEIPVIFPEDHRFAVDRAQILANPEGDERSEVALLATGMMVAPALAAATTLNAHGVATTIVNAPVIKPLDTTTVLTVAAAVKVVITAENHSIIGGLGSAVAETLAEAGLGRPLRRVGLQDTFAEGAQDTRYLFTKYGLTVQHLVTTAWSALDRPGTPPSSSPLQANADEYSPV